MKRALPIAGLAVAAGIASAGLAAPGQPMLRSAALVDRHVRVEYTVGELTPGVIQVALRPTKSVSGSFLAANLVVSEVVSARPDPTTGVVRWRTRKALPFRRFYVQVSGIATGCKPGRGVCHVRWSNMRIVSAHGG
jgi:hypothetical protein